jgi:hypothetical protein
MRVGSEFCPREPQQHGSPAFIDPILRIQSHRKSPCSRVIREQAAIQTRPLLSSFVSVSKLLGFLPIRKFVHILAQLMHQFDRFMVNEYSWA